MIHLRFFKFAKHLMRFWWCRPGDAQIHQRRDPSASDVVHAALRLHHDQESKLATLRAALIEGETSGLSTPFDIDAFIASKQCGQPQSP